jgi:superfamily II DNA or RNA helicase
MNLRDYQQKAVEELAAFVDNEQEKSVCLMLPTGAGKTFTLSSFLYQLLLEKFNHKIVVLVHREELLVQFSNALKKLGINCETVTSGKYSFRRTNVFVAMVETAHRREGFIESADLIVIDECHIGNFKKAIAKATGKIIGITATPMSASKKDPLSNYFQRLIIGAEISDLVEQGYLAKSETFAWKKEGADKLKVRQGEYDSHEMGEFYSREMHIKNCIDVYWKYCAGKKTIIFNVNIEHNDLVYLALKREGLNVRSIDSNSADKEKRKEIFDWFSNNFDAILCNVGIATTGLDVPDIERVMLNRLTKSLPLYLQMVGRGSRVTDTKDSFVILDLGGTIDLYGHWYKQRDWPNLFHRSISDREAASLDGEGVASQKMCKECGFLNHASAKVCKDCGVELPVKPPKEDPKGGMVLVGDAPGITTVISPIIQYHKLIEAKDWALIFAIANKIVKDYEFKTGKLFDYRDAQLMDQAAKHVKPYMPEIKGLMKDKLQGKASVGSIKWAITHIAKDALAKRGG